MKRFWHKAKHKIVFGCIFFFGILFGASLVLSSIISSRNDQIVPPMEQVMPTPTATTNPQKVTLEAEIICLPHRDTSGPQTLECAIGLKTADGKYYALDTNALPTQPVFNNGKRLRANGVLTPIENLSSDHWQKYNVQGIFSATDSVEVLP